jgi:hypothetical protein
MTTAASIPARPIRSNEMEFLTVVGVSMGCFIFGVMTYAIARGLT